MDDLRAQQDYRSLKSGELADAMKLDHFFEALGPVMRLPPKDDEDPEPRAVRRAGSSGRRTAALAGIALTLVTIAAGAPAILRALQTTESVPPGLHGSWSTVARRYAGRSFDVSDSTLRLGLGGRDVTYPIAGVASRDSADAAIYTIRYRDGETELEFALAIGPDSVAMIRNLPDVGWRKVVR
jgi:hypothetical protein